MNKKEILESFEKELDNVLAQHCPEDCLSTKDNCWAIDKIKAFLSKVLDEFKESNVTGETSDGFHTFNELYEFRKVFNAVLFNEWYSQGKYDVHKSYYHSDREKCFGGGWFIVVATLPSGDISNHYENKDWNLFQCEIRKTAKKWDRHTAQDVVKRLKQMRENN